jgi:glycosyltransferase involved in cell wall biosynthesis
VVAHASGAAAEVITHEQTGLLVRAGTGGLAGAVARLAAEPRLRDRLAANARDSVVGRTWEDAVAELVGYYPTRMLASTAV